MKITVPGGAQPSRMSRRRFVHGMAGSSVLDSGSDDVSFLEVSVVKQISGIATLFLAVLPLSAGAHAHLVQASPANDSVLTHAPADFRLQLNEPARLTALSIQKDNESPHKIGGLPTAASAEWVIPAPTLAPGSYTLSYRLLSDDSHIMSGSIKFRIREP
jgi:methionine-rich copper-binding protein CopC